MVCSCGRGRHEARDTFFTVRLALDRAVGAIFPIWEPSWARNKQRPWRFQFDAEGGHTRFHGIDISSSLQPTIISRFPPTRSISLVLC
jgi:hypothetical protein